MLLLNQPSMASLRVRKNCSCLSVDRLAGCLYLSFHFVEELFLLFDVEPWWKDRCLRRSRLRQPGELLLEFLYLFNILISSFFTVGNGDFNHLPIFAIFLSRFVVLVYLVLGFGY